jgi:hypothetical protein
VAANSGKSKAVAWKALSAISLRQFGLLLELVAKKESGGPSDASARLLSPFRHKVMAEGDTNFTHQLRASPRHGDCFFR